MEWQSNQLKAPLPQVTVPAAPTWNPAWGGDNISTVRREEDRATKPTTVPARNILCAARVRLWRAAPILSVHIATAGAVVPRVAVPLP